MMLQTSGSSPLIQTLTICLKENDHNFLSRDIGITQIPGLYENGICLFTQILKKPDNAQLKIKCSVGGIVSLLINAIERESLK